MGWAGDRSRGSEAAACNSSVPAGARVARGEEHRGFNWEGWQGPGCASCSLAVPALEPFKASSVPPSSHPPKKVESGK